MHEPLCCRRVAQRLGEHGMPPSRIQRVTRELAEHWEDIHAAALRNGVSPTEAAAGADARLGQPDQLAANIIDAMRQSSWFGRHPVLSVCVLSLLFAPLLMAAIVFPLALLDEWLHFTRWNATGNRPNAYLVTGTLWFLHYASMIASLLWIGFRVWTAGLGRKWVLAICAWCALAALFRYFDADPVKRNVVVYLTFPWRLNVHTAIVLLVHAVAATGFLFAAKTIQNQTCNNIQTKELV